MEVKLEKLIETLIKETPNDMELGKKIRVLVNKYNLIKKESQTNKTSLNGIQ
jgi:hypothetical protein